MTWTARKSHTKHYMYQNFTPLTSKEQLLAIRGMFDGGVSIEGSAVGFWLQGLISCSGTQEWRLLQETGALLEGAPSAMETEFTAALQLFSAAREATTKILSSRI